MGRLGRVAVGVLLGGVLFALAGCAALGQAIGVQPKADAPTFSGVGTVIWGHENEARQTTRNDQSGAVGAQGSASQSAEQTQTFEIPAEAVEALIGAAQTALTGGSPEAASAILGAIKPKPKKGAPPAGPPSPAPAPAAASPPVHVPTAEEVAAAAAKAAADAAAKAANDAATGGGK